MNTLTKEHRKHNLSKLYPMSSFGVVSGSSKQIRITKLEDRLNPAIGFPHKHNFYHIVIVTKGTGWHEIDFYRYKAQGGSVFFMLPSQVHAWSFSKNTTGIVIEFEELSDIKIEENFLFSELLNPKNHAIHLDGKDKEFIFNLAKEMSEDYLNNDQHTNLLLKLNVNKFLVYYNRLTIKGNVLKLKDDEISLKVSQFRIKFLEVLESHYKKEHSVEFYAHKFNLTPKSLSAKLNKIVGKNVRDIIHDRCLLESKRLLAYSDFSVSEISSELGFEDSNYFTRFFRLKIGITPTKFRQKVRHNH